MPNAQGNYTPPESGDLPEHGKKILSEVYSKNRREHPDWSKEKCAKIGWAAVENAGYHKKEGKWVKKGALSPDQPTLSQGTTVHKAIPESHDLEWGFDIKGILGSIRKIRGTFHVPKVDKDNEIITSGAMDKAMHDYMHLPIISEYHKERPIGIVTKSWKTSDGKYQFEGVIKATHDCDDIWEKVKKGEYDMLSIAGKRTEMSEECSMHPLLRGDKPCITKGLRLDSISACDEGARNDQTSLEMAKASEGSVYLCSSTLELTQVKDTLIKATDTTSSLIHVTTDGTRKKGECMACKKGKKPPELVKSEEQEDPETEEKKAEVDEEKEVEEEEKTEEKKAEDGEEELEEEESAEMKILKEIHATLKELVSSDKKVHASVEKGEETHIAPPMKKGLKDGEPGQESEEETGEERAITKKATSAPVDPAEFKKAMDTISALQAKIEALESQPATKGVVIIKSDLKDGDRIESDAEAIIKANGGKLK